MSSIIGFILTLIVGGFVFTVVATILYVLIASAGEAAAIGASRIHNPINRKKNK